MKSIEMFRNAMFVNKNKMLARYTRLRLLRMCLESYSRRKFMIANRKIADSKNTIGKSMNLAKNVKHASDKFISLWKKKTKMPFNE